MERRKRKRIGEMMVVRVGDNYCGSTIKSITIIDGNRCPTKAYYDCGDSIPSSDKCIGRAVLDNGFIHYLKPHTFVV